LKEPIADRRAAIRTESEPERANTVSRVEDRELCGLAGPPPRHSALDHLSRGDATVVEPTTDLRIAERRLYPRHIRHREWTQRDNSIGERWIRRAQPIAGFYRTALRITPEHWPRRVFRPPVPHVPPPPLAHALDETL
jgi:hypothetical protein